MSLADALQRVGEAQHLVAAVRSASSSPLPEARHRARHEPLQKLLAHADPGEHQSLAAEKLHITALDLFLDKHFRNSRDMRMYKANVEPVLK